MRTASFVNASGSVGLEVGKGTLIVNWTWHVDGALAVSTFRPGGR